jgi:NitT/TauT family transport system substrate-binding protein
LLFNCQRPEWVKNHTPEEIAKTIKPSFPDTDEEILITVVKRYKECDTWNTDPVLKEEALDLLQEIMKEAEQLEKKVPYEKVVTLEFANKSIKNTN